MDFPSENINTDLTTFGTNYEAIFKIYEINVHPKEILRMNNLPDIIRFTLLNQKMSKTFNALIHVLETKLNLFFENEYEKKWINIVFNLCILFRKDNFPSSIGESSSNHNPIIIEYMEKTEINFLLRILMDINHQILLRIMDDMKKQLVVGAHENVIQELCKLFLRQQNLMYRFLTLCQSCTRTAFQSGEQNTQQSFNLTEEELISSPINSPIKNSPKSIWSKRKSSQRNSFNSRTLGTETKNSFEILNQMLESDIPNVNK